TFAPQMPLTVEFEKPIKEKRYLYIRYANSDNYFTPEWRIDGRDGKGWVKGEEVIIDVEDLGEGEHWLETRLELVDGSNVYVANDRFTFVVAI
ncbi:hypothetical protein HDV05_002761, partial [Chytridiales sp. JEL 0842]